MLSERGAPLHRRYYCPEHEAIVPSDEIVRGFQLDDGGYVVVTDEELEGLAPEKSRDIDLRRFVKQTEISPLLFERAYFMAPASDSTKAYRLLAQTLERTGRAGIATFVMRGKEHLVAILSEAGILRAETLRFAEELRTPANIGLADAIEPGTTMVREMRKAIRQLNADSIDTRELADSSLTASRQLVEGKLKQGRDVLEPPPEERTEIEQQANVIDLMEVLKQSLAKHEQAETGQRKKAGQRDGPNLTPEPRLAKVKSPELKAETKQQLYERAKALDIDGRSQMSKPELIRDLLRHLDRSSDRFR